MNIFALDIDPEQAAAWHCDAHVVKMTLETAQIISTVNRLSGKTEGVYRSTHINHPCTKWTLESTENYRWLWRLGMNLCVEYFGRYDKVHKSRSVFELTKTPPVIVPRGKLTKFPQCMPEKYHQPNPIWAYRNYYKFEKNKGKLGTWRRNKPWWWDLDSFTEEFNF